MLVLVAARGNVGELACVAQSLNGLGVDGEGSERGVISREGGKSTSWKVVGVSRAKQENAFRRGEVE